MHVPVISLSQTTANKADCVKYDKYDLRQRRMRCWDGIQLKALSVNTVKRIRHLKLQRRHKRGHRGGVTKENMMPSTQYIEVNNLITVQITGVMPRELNLCNWKLVLINVGSLKSKEDLLFDYQT